MAVVRQRRLPHLNLTVELPDSSPSAAADASAAATAAGDLLRFLLPLPPPPQSSSCSATNPVSSSAEFRLCDFEKLRVLGRGNGGTVYKVRHRRTSYEYALKFVHVGDDAAARRQAAREVDILRLAGDAENVVGFHAALPTPSGDVALVMEHMAGGSLDAVLSRRGRRPLPEAALAAVARGALRGLASLHARRIVHRDIKPANLLVSAAGEVKIADFGSGKVLRRSLDPCRSYVGTCAYMSPERFDPGAHGGDYDPYAADVWSLGLAVLELQRGHFPLLPAGARPDWAALMCAICVDGEEGRLMAALGEDGTASDEFRGFIECCLQRDSGKRWSVEELLGHPFVAGADPVESQRALRDLLVIDAADVAVAVAVEQP